MHQSELNRAVADATGESVTTIGNMGFTLAAPCEVLHDPTPAESCNDLEFKCIDWDVVDAERNVPLMFQPAA